MRQLFISIIALLTFAVTLTACGGGASGGTSAVNVEDSDNDNDDGAVGLDDTDNNADDSDDDMLAVFEPSKVTVFNALNMLETSEQKSVNIPTYLDGDNNEISYGSLTAISGASATDNVDRSVTLQGLAVNKLDNSDYVRTNTDAQWSDEQQTQIDRQVTISQVNAPHVSITFGDSGYITGVTAYVDNNYTALSNDSTDTNSFSATNDDGVSVAVERGTGFFGFVSNYMTSISWGSEKSTFSDELTEDSIHTIDGMMLAGIETANSDILDSGTIAFSGKGSGAYGELADDASVTEYKTIFDVTAGVNFDTKSVDIDFHDTLKCENAECDLVTDVSEQHDFNANAISFVNEDDETVNSISHEIYNADESLMTGRIDARFYGTATREFGGTFALSNSESYYYGAFGAQRNGIAYGDYALTAYIADNSYSVTNAPETSIVDGDGVAVAYKAFSDTATDADGVDKIFTVNGLTSENVRNHVSYSRVNTNQDWTTYADSTQNETSVANINGSAAAITFNDGDITAATLYLNDGANDIAYTADSFTNANGVATAAINNVVNVTNNTITIDRSDTAFGFATDYMAFVSWDISKTQDNLFGLSDNTYDRGGIMLTGIETANMPTIYGAYDFTGKGKGVYQDSTEQYKTAFDVTATVDFTNSNVTIVSSNSCKADDCENEALTELDFNTGLIAYTDNNISKTDLVVGGLTGTLNARFYGDEAREFGGAFALADSDTSYYGAFGSTTDQFLSPFEIWSTSTVPDEVVVGTIPTDGDGVAYNSITGAFNTISASLGDSDADNNLTADANTQFILPIVPSYFVSNNSDNDGFAIEDAVIKFNLGRATVDGKASPVVTKSTLYVDDNTYVSKKLYYGSKLALAKRGGLHGITGKTGFVRLITTALNDDFGGDALVNHGFNPKYLMMVKWTLGAGWSYSMSGMETAIADIPTDAGNVTFVGGGNGRIYAAGSQEQYVKFSVIANIDFAEHTAKFTTAHIDATSYADWHFETPTFKYDENTNDLSSVITADNGARGNLNARFYGTGDAAASEIGGSFILQHQTSKDQKFVGAFGTCKRDSRNNSCEY
ncbi:MAG: transferrin-binding protein-like solute binding protein [Alphaproteobacteria bacterium]|nr:transferrin-binding protein-like solute binding protein [Alphaproteobacteria bacterium]